MSDSATPWTAAHQAPLSSTVSSILLKLMFTELMMPSNGLILCHPFSFCPQSFPASEFFQWVCFLHQVVKVLEFQLQHQSFQWILRVDFLLDDLFDLLAVQGTLKSLLQHHNSKVSILRCSAFFTVQLLHPYMTTRKITVLTRWIFVGKVKSLLFNLLSQFVSAFLSRSKRL